MAEAYELARLNAEIESLANEVLLNDEDLLAYAQYQNELVSAQNILLLSEFLKMLESRLPRQYNSTDMLHGGTQRVTWQNLEAKFGSAAYFERTFRVSYQHLPTLLDKLNLPLRYACTKTVTNRLEGLLIVLFRLSTGSTFAQMAPIFDLTTVCLSRIFNGTVTRIWEQIDDPLRSLDVHPLMTNRSCLEAYSEAIEAKTGVALEAVGFIDCNITDISRPSVGQQIMYSGKSKTHAVKHGLIMLPNGIGFVFGPSVGRSHDARMVIEHNVNAQLRNSIGQDFCIYGDAGFKLSDKIVTPYRNGNPQQMSFNRQMRKGRISIEHWFGNMQTTFPFLNNKQRLQILASSCGVSTIWCVSAHLMNCLVCIRGHSPIADYFGLETPEIDAYLAGF